MYKKIIFATVLTAFACMQMGLSLDCFYCNSPQSCNSPGKVTCNQLNANSTRDELHKYFEKVPNTTTKNFDCIYMNYTSNNQIVMQLAGCHDREVDACKLSLEPTIGSSWLKQNCTQCSGNLCNGRNPASAASVSLYTLIASVMGVMIVKVRTH